MTQDIKKLQESRNGIFHDFYNNIIPERMPVAMNLSLPLIAECASLDSIDVQFDYTKLKNVAEDVVKNIYSDSCPMAPAGLTARIPGAYQILESQSFIMGASGQMQHPEVVGMPPEEYDELLGDTYAYLIEKVLPRQFKALSLDDPVRRADKMMIFRYECNKQRENTASIVRDLTAKYGYYNAMPQGASGFSVAPYDFLGDQLRSFSGISADIRRHKSKIAEACEKILPLAFNMGMPTNPDPQGNVNMPLHMPTFMREKDFVEVWLPTYMRLIEQYAARGVRTRPFHEHDWMRYLDIIQDFPAGTIMAFEYGDPQTIKDKLGKKFIISGLFPLNLLKQGTKQQVLDKAKELLDIMLPGCGYLFAFDKVPLMLNDINMENYQALSEFLRDYATYDNAGTPYGMEINSENYTIDENIGKFESKYLTNWDEYKSKYPLTPDYVKDVLYGYDMENLKFYMDLLV